MEAATVYSVVSVVKVLEQVLGEVKKSIVEANGSAVYRTGLIWAMILYGPTQRCCNLEEIGLVVQSLFIIS